MSCRLILVRHAQSAPSPDLPEADWPLSKAGKRQAEDLAAVLRDHGVNALASSPYARAIATLNPFAQAAGLDIAVDADLRERNLGGWLPDLAAVEEAVRRMHADLGFCLEGGETGSACLRRFEAALVRVAAANEGACVAVGSHGGVLGHLLARIHDDLPDGFWRRIRNPHLFFLDWDGALLWRGEQPLDGSQGVLGMAG
jgi:2,3-bisphosphoglycerate-dependent phosphoglycerate mutase